MRGTLACHTNQEQLTLQAEPALIRSGVSPTHTDHLGRPVPSRFASFDEVLALTEAAGEGGAGSIAYLAESAVQGYDARDRERLVELAHRSGLPVVVQGMGFRPGARERWEDQTSFLAAARERGAAIYSMLRTQPFMRPFNWRRGTSQDITYSNNIIAEGLANASHPKGEHSKGSLIHDNATGILIYRNLYAHNYERNPLLKGGVHAAVVNNMIFDPGAQAIHYNLMDLEWTGKPKQAGEHKLNLLLRCGARPDNRLLDLSRRELMNIELRLMSGEEDDTSRMPEHHRRPYVPRIEHVLDRQRVGPMPRNELRDPVVDLAEARRKRIARSRPNDATFDETDESRLIATNDAIPGVRGARVDAENEHERIGAR